MLVVHVTSEFVNGGVASVIKNLLLEQYEQGVLLAIITSSGSKEYLESWLKKNNLEIPQYYIASHKWERPVINGRINRTVIQQIRTEFPREKIIFHFHNPVSVGLISSLRGLTLLCTIHGKNTAHRQISHWIFQRTMKRVIKQGGYIVGCCQQITDYYATKLKAPNKMRTVVNGVRDVEKVGNKYISNSEQLNIGFVGYLDELKGWKILCSAYNQLKRSIQEYCHLYLAGTVSPEDKESLKKILKNNAGITYLGQCADVSTALMPYLDILVLPSKSEGLPMTILEAMQAGIPILATDVGGISELVCDGVSGFLVKRNVESVKEKIELLFYNRELLATLKAGARAVYEEKGSSKKMAEGYFQIYNELISSADSGE